MREVEVTFVHAGSGEVIGEATLSPEDLPETFLASTTLELGGRSWSVTTAHPPRREEFARTGQLRLVIAPVQMMDPRELLFSLPTICDVLPADGPAADGTEHVMREDDWRQIELVSSALRSEIDRELASIEAIHRSHRSGPGFDELHVRSSIERPLAGRSLRIHDLPLTGEPRPLRLDGHGARVDGGFVATIEGATIYGAASAGILETVGVLACEDSSALEAWAARHELLLVDWCSCSISRGAE